MQGRVGDKSVSHLNFKRKSDTAQSATGVETVGFIISWRAHAINKSNKQVELSQLQST